MPWRVERVGSVSIRKRCMSLAKVALSLFSKMLGNGLLYFEKI
jgi:hypothetical protein